MIYPDEIPMVIFVASAVGFIAGALAASWYVETLAAFRRRRSDLPRREAIVIRPARWRNEL